MKISTILGATPAVLALGLLLGLKPAQALNFQFYQEQQQQQQQQQQEQQETLDIASSNSFAVSKSEPCTPVPFVGGAWVLPIGFAAFVAYRVIRRA